MFQIKLVGRVLSVTYSKVFSDGESFWLKENHKFRVCVVQSDVYSFFLEDYFLCLCC